MTLKRPDPLHGGARRRAGHMTMYFIAIEWRCGFHSQGDTQIRYFEITDASPYCHWLSMFQSNVPQRGVGLMPKRKLDYMNCEVMRFYKVQQTKGLVEPISMTVPRKVGDGRGRRLSTVHNLYHYIPSLVPRPLHS